MSQNYDSSQVGVPYVRVHRIEINYPESGAGLIPTTNLYQSEAVKLADGESRKLRDLVTLSRTVDLVNDGNDLIPLVDATTGAPLAAPVAQALGAMVSSGHVSLNLVMLALLAVVRQEQTRVQ